MKCEFDSMGVFGVLHEIFLLSAILSFGSSFVFLIFEENVLGASVSFIIFLVSFTAENITSVLNNGYIYVLESKVIITHKFFNKKVFVSYISYRDIEYAEYNVKAVHSRMGFLRYDITLTITKKSGRAVKVVSGLDIKENMPTDKPDEYKEYLNEQPFVKMCRFINEKSRML